MSVLQRKELEESPLADLHAIASELGIERLPRDAAGRAGQGDLGGAGWRGDEDVRRQRIRGRRGADLSPSPRTRTPKPDARGARSSEAEEPAEPEGDPVTGVLDVLPNGSGFLRDRRGRATCTSRPPRSAAASCAPATRSPGPCGPRGATSAIRRWCASRPSTAATPSRPRSGPLFADLTPVHPTERLPAPAALDACRSARARASPSAARPAPAPPGCCASSWPRWPTSTPTWPCRVVLVGARPEEVTELDARRGRRAVIRRRRSTARPRPRPRPPSWRSSAPSGWPSAAATPSWWSTRSRPCPRASRGGCSARPASSRRAARSR